MFVPIANEPRDYAWGSTSLLADFLGVPASGRPQAELWLGAHPACPAVVVGGEHEGRTLAEATEAAGRAQPTILLKVLAAAEPLSLQAHPDAARAAAGFAREDALGIPRDASHRSYRDPFAKPELIVAVTRFEALSGFRPEREALAVLEALAEADARVATIPGLVRSGGALAWLLSGEPEVRAAVEATVEAMPGLAERFPVEADTLARLHAAHPMDPGVLVALLLNRVSLAPGEALFLPAGNLHAYLEGLGIELMGPSDNVIRGGLTAKHIDVPELLEVVDSAPLDDPRLPAEQLDGATGYRPDAPFELRRVTGEHALGPARALVLAMAPTRITIDGEEHSMDASSSAWIDTAGPVGIVSTDAWVALERDTPGAG